MKILKILSLILLASSCFAGGFNGSSGGGGTWGSITGTLSNQADLNNVVGAAGSIPVSTGTIKAQVNAVAVSTGAIQTQVTAITVSTGSINTKVLAVAVDTGTLAISTSSIQSQINSHFPVSLSTGVIGILPAANLVSTVAYTSVPNTFISSQTVTSTMTANSFIATGIGAGQFQATQGSAPSGISNVDIFYANSNDNQFHAINNAGADVDFAYEISGASATLQSTTVSIGTIGRCTNCGTDSAGISTSTINGFVEFGAIGTKIK